MYGESRRITDGLPAKKLNINVVKSTSVTFGGSFTLAELRQFVAACSGLQDSATVKITKYDARDQRDISTTTISVNDA